VVDISENGDNLNNFNYDCVFVGRLERMKGVLELIEIWRLVVNQMPRARLEIIGNGLLEDEIRSKIILCELLPNIDLLGFLDGEEKEAVLRKSKVFLHPSIYDSGGMAAAEAMGFGLPVVGFELANDYYVRGIVRVPLLNLNEFARAIIKLLTDSTYYSKMSQEAKEYSKEWSWDFRGDLMISAVCKLFQENVM
jgi:glycosyltransferase involved in cell wall biosynthesis